MPDSFNKNLDKITERETVYDFVERLPIGNNFTVGTHTFPAGRKLLSIVIGCIYKLLPQSLVANIENLVVYNYTIPKGATNVALSLSGLSGTYSLAAVRSDTTGLNITAAFTLNGSTLTSAFDSAYPYTDNISILIKKS